jgi:hypothetical protein
MMTFIASFQKLTFHVSNSLIYSVGSLRPTVAPTMAIANSKGMLGREYSCSQSSAKQAGGRIYMMQLLKRHAFPKEENTTSCNK